MCDGVCAGFCEIEWVLCKHIHCVVFFSILLGFEWQITSNSSMSKSDCVLLSTQEIVFFHFQQWYTQNPGDGTENTEPNNNNNNWSWSISNSSSGKGDGNSSKKSSSKITTAQIVIWSKRNWTAMTETDPKPNVL